MTFDPASMLPATENPSPAIAPHHWTHLRRYAGRCAFVVDHVELAVIPAFVGRRELPDHLGRGDSGAQQVKPVPAVVGIDQRLGAKGANAAFGVRAERADREKRVATATPNAPVSSRAMIDQVMPADHTQYNAAVDLIERNVAAGRGGKTAYIDDSGATTYGQLAERVDRAASALRGLGLKREQRIGIAMLDSADWVALFLGAIKAGIVPVALNTLLTPRTTSTS